MARIKTLKGDNLLGTNDSANEFIYPVTIYDAVYDTDNKSLAETLPYRTIRDISNEFKEANEDILDISLEEFLNNNLLYKVPPVPGFIGKFYNEGQYYLYIFNSSDTSGWKDLNNWVSILLDRDITNDLGESKDLVVSQRLLDIVNKNIGLDEYTEYSTGIAYSAGTPVLYNNELFKIAISITSTKNTGWSKVSKERTSLKSLLESDIDNLIKNHIITITDLEDTSDTAVNTRKVLFTLLQSNISDTNQVFQVVDTNNNIWYNCTYNIENNNTEDTKINLCLFDNYIIHASSTANNTERYTTKNVKIYTLDVDGNCENKSIQVYNNRVLNTMIPNNEIGISKLNQSDLNTFSNKFVLNYTISDFSNVSNNIQYYRDILTSINDHKAIRINVENVGFVDKADILIGNILRLHIREILPTIEYTPGNIESIEEVENVEDKDIFIFLNSDGSVKTVEYSSASNTLILNAEDIFDLPEFNNSESTITSEKNKQAFELLSTHIKSGKNIVINYEDHFLYLQRTGEDEFLNMWFSNIMNSTEYHTAIQDFTSCNSMNLILNSEGLLSLYWNSLNVVFDVTLPYDYIIGNDYDEDLNKSFYNRLRYLNVISSGSGCNVRLYNDRAYFNADSIFFSGDEVIILFHNIVSQRYEDLYVIITKDGIMSYEIYDSNPLDEVIIRQNYLPEKEEAIGIYSLIASSLFNNGLKRVYTPVFITNDDRKLYPLQISYISNDNSTKLEMLFRGDKEDFIVTIDSEGNFNIDYKELDIFNKEGDYPDMSVGVAENLVGRGEAIDTMFSYRSSGGVKSSGVKRSIETGDARITSIKGNSVVVNQLIGSVLWMSDESQGISATNNDDGSVTITNSKQNNFLYIYNNRIKDITRAGHILMGEVDCPSSVFFDVFKAASSDPNTSGAIKVAGESGLKTPVFMFKKVDGNPFNAGESITVSNLRVRDLTQMFGAGNEPTTVEEYYARVGELPDEYDAGTLRDMQVSAIETTGFNQWDEEWEQGEYALTTGNPAVNSENKIRSKNKIKIIPNTEYFLKIPYQQGWSYSGHLFFYDNNGKFISYNFIPVNKKTFVTPSNAHYLNFQTRTEYGAIYKNDICLNLSHSGYKNGEYRPYELFRRALPDLSKYFEGGVMRSAGNVCDEFKYNPTTQQWEAIQRVGVVDLGSLDWKWFDAFKSFTTISMVNSLVYRSPLNVPNIFTTFATSASYGVFGSIDESKQIDKTTSINPSGTLMIRDRTYTDNDPVAFKASLQGVMLNYELSEPIVKPVTENLNLVYDVNDFGTERAIQPEDSAPFRADVVYGFNAIDTIRTNAEAIEQLFARVAALESKTATTSE